jgi:hypothetical protein
MRRLALISTWFLLLAIVAPVLVGAAAGWARGWPDQLAQRRLVVDRNPAQRGG